jgi:hypothetical protein
VPALVILHISFGSEGFLAEIASERLLISVDSHMDYQVGPLRESFSTTLERAMKWLRSVVPMEMSLQSALSGEAFTAIHISASEPLGFVIFLIVQP